MATNFTFYRIFCATPPELEDERRTFEAAVARFVEAVSMPDAVLFAPASLPPPMHVALSKPLIESNIQMCDFIVHVFGERWPDPLFAGWIDYALASVEDPSTATRSVTVLFRNYKDAAPELRRLREALASEGKCRLEDFNTTDDLSMTVRSLLTAWYAPLRPALGAAVAGE
jgi:hypothetical protein